MKILVFFTALLISTSVLAENQAKLPLPRIQTLSNGLQTVWFEDAKLPLIDLAIVIRAGFRDDAPGKSGTTELLSSLLGGGGKSLETSRAIEALGASRYVTAEDDNIIIGIHGLSTDADKLLDLLGKSVLSPDLSQSEVERESLKILERWNHLEDFGDLSSAWVQRRIVTAKTSYGRGSLFSLKEFKALRSEDLQTFYQKYFIPSNSVLMVTGKINREAFTEKLLTVFGKWANPAKVLDRRYQAVYEDPKLAPYRKQMVVVDRPGANQVHLRLAFPAPLFRSQAYYPLIVDNALIAEFFGSRLNAQIRDKTGLTYFIESGFSFAKEFSEFSIHSTASAENIGLLLQKIMEVIEGFKTDPVTQEEMDRAKAYILGAFPVSSPSIAAVASKWLGGYLLGKDVAHLNQYSDEIRRVSLEAVRASLNSLLDLKKVSIVASGDFKAIEEGMKKSGAQMGSKKLGLKRVLVQDLR